ncbi:hypothetical protein HK097_009332 [Rhizophlyctis rosea]|uniref:DUF21-domain-containing protein n=1 Tax=Rhizophlyctis rosea TaxID=64517 RepID=A0AAD5S938_9FUNG|nr:hypothetical protein HK097_009332 [Rhizophlyctis rosea]
MSYSYRSGIGLVALALCNTANASPVISAKRLPSTGIVAATTSAFVRLVARQEGGEHHTDKSQLWWKILVIFVLTCITALVAGLTLGLMSLDPTDLRILKTAGSEKEKKAAEKIEPIRKLGHQLLVTFLVINAIINETLPILLDDVLGGGVLAILIATILVLVFGEIIPQAVCSRYGLQIGAFFVWPVRIMVYLVWVLAWPIAKLLDMLLGAGHGMMYKKAELHELIALHAKEGGGDLTTDEVMILQGTLGVHTKGVESVMTPLDKVEMLSTSTHLTRTELQQIILLGHSRLPIFSDERTNVIGILLVKSLILLNPDESTPVNSLPLITTVPKVNVGKSLFDMLNLFQEGASHMALVYDQITLVGIITLEDVIEEIIQEEIVDETDVFISNDQTERVERPAPNHLVHRLKPQLKRNWSLPVGAVGKNNATAGVDGVTHTGGDKKRPKKFMGRAAHRVGSDGGLVVVDKESGVVSRKKAGEVDRVQVAASNSAVDGSDRKMEAPSTVKESHETVAGETSILGGGLVSDPSDNS